MRGVWVILPPLRWEKDGVSSSMWLRDSALCVAVTAVVRQEKQQ